MSLLCRICSLEYCFLVCSLFFLCMCVVFFYSVKRVFHREKDFNFDETQFINTSFMEHALGTL